ncbi:MAG: transcription elongation protein SprT [Bacteroidetes bacterium]|nr:transcription elongation protein SprT [Bacteroidota bacterium]MBI3481691.1 transcription elongation protein SprT [Bacteroidota bacterium]
MNFKEIEDILVKHVPTNAVGFCVSLWQEYPFNFKLRKARQSKVGDFTCKTGHVPQITVNRDLHPFLFLMTYVHEVAHLRVHQLHGFKAEAHGDEWKSVFQNLMQPLLNSEIFTEPLLSGLKKHMASPKASSFADSELTHLFRSVDDREKESVLLSHIPEGSVFHLHGKWFRKGKLRRTRVLCKEVNTRRQYLVPVDAVIKLGQLYFT